MRDEFTRATFRHDMPFGTELLPEGRTQFRLWAPAQERVTVALSGTGGERSLPMTRAADGMFTLAAEDVGAGTRYSFVLSGGQRVPDPASRYQPDDVHGPSEVIDPTAYHWVNGDWQGRPWEEAVITEAHVGCYSSAGTFDGMRRRLDHLVDVGITALELMPLADFEGRRNWGYDGVLPFAPDSAYGRPDDLKRLIDEAHGRGLMVLLDVVHNHFGPSGNYLSLTAPAFFTDRYRTPWGSAINFEDRDGYVRDFFVHNALYWLNEYRFDGLRFDAVHAIFDKTQPDILRVISAAVRHELPDRHIHLILENDNNQSSYLDRRRPAYFDAQWNDDYHHAAHVLATGEKHAHFADYAASPVDSLAACLARGFFHNGVPSAFRGGEVRGEATDFLAPTAFVDFLQNHDQIGNRNDGKRLSALIDDPPLRALTAITLLSPSIPMFFMGEEWASERPFYYFCDFHEDLATAVREGRRKEFERQNEETGSAFVEPTDPIHLETFLQSKLDWDERRRARPRAHMVFVCRLLLIRQAAIVPALKNMPRESGQYEVADGRALLVRWRLAGGKTLTLAANLSSRPASGLEWQVAGKELVALNGTTAGGRLQTISPWDVHVYLEPGR